MHSRQRPQSVRCPVAPFSTGQTTARGDAPASPGRWLVVLGCAAWGAAACALVLFAAWRYAQPGPAPVAEAPRTLKELFVDLSPAVPVVEAVGVQNPSGTEAVVVMTLLRKR
jgi:hypothetical protein